MVEMAGSQCAGDVATLLEGALVPAQPWLCKNLCRTGLQGTTTLSVGSVCHCSFRGLGEDKPALGVTGFRDNGSQCTDVRLKRNHQCSKLFPSKSPFPQFSFLFTPREVALLFTLALNPSLCSPSSTAGLVQGLAAFPSSALSCEVWIPPLPSTAGCLGSHLTIDIHVSAAAIPEESQRRPDFCVYSTSLLLITHPT